MKKTLALLLCVAMLLTLAVGCKKKIKPEELTEARIADDVVSNTQEYSYTHITGTPDMKEMTVLTRDEVDGDIVLTLEATVTYPNADVTLKANVVYQSFGPKWQLTRFNVTESSIEVTGAPSQSSVVNELANYMSIVGSAYSVLDDKYQPLYFDINSADLEMAYEAGAKTAALTLSYTSDKLTFAGSYTLTFDDAKGWVLETKAQDDGRQHPLLHLTKLEQKK